MLSDQSVFNWSYIYMSLSVMRAHFDVLPLGLGGVHSKLVMTWFFPQLFLTAGLSNQQQFISVYILGCIIIYIDIFYIYKVLVAN